MNPLKLFLQNNSIEEAAKISGLNKNTIRSTARMLEEEIGGIHLKTYIAIKDKLGVDLLDWGE